MGSSVRGASDTWIGAGACTAQLSLRGVPALVFYRLDEAEHARRRRAGAARLDRIDALQTLLALPAAVPVATDTLDPQLRRELPSVPRGAMERKGTAVVRVAVRPLAVDLAVVRAAGGQWRKGLVHASRFAPFCSRALLIDGALDPLDREELVLEAAFYGIGLLMDDGAGLEMVVAPRPYRPQRHTAAAWCFVEELYQRLV